MFQFIRDLISHVMYLLCMAVWGAVAVSFVGLIYTGIVVNAPADVIRPWFVNWLLSMAAAVFYAFPYTMYQRLKEDPDSWPEAIAGFVIGYNLRRGFGDDNKDK